jgi:hypothetical protein
MNRDMLSEWHRLYIYTGHVMEDDGGKSEEFWAERIAIMWIDGGMKGMDEEHFATICTKR